MDNIRVLFGQEDLDHRIEELAEQISFDFKKKVYCVPVLTGAWFFFSDLVKAMRRYNTEIEFSPIKVSSYKGTESSGTPYLELDIKENISGRDVLLVEDIVDTGHTVKFATEHLFLKGANDVHICTLLDKPSRRSHRANVDIDYVGFQVPDLFVIGYGLDFNQRYRELPFIGVLEPEKKD